jgi:sporulation protein YlmC with PRC-barrel domain
MRRLTTFTAIMALSASTVALAANQEKDMQNDAKMKNETSVQFMTEQTDNQELASEIIGQNVYTSNNEDIGEVNNLLVGQDGNIQGVIIGVGGFLGLGEKDVVLPMSALTMKDESEERDAHIMVEVTREQLEAAPSFVYLENAEKENNMSEEAMKKEMKNTEGEAKKKY